MSKNEMKANHNQRAIAEFFILVGKYDVKERDESKSQPHQALPIQMIGWQI